jgi:glycosyltransferase involved in cell wall biosynthesis
MNVVHLTASTFFGGPERQMLGLADHSPAHASTFVSFAEGGRCEEFLGEVRKRGHAALALVADTPALAECLRELTQLLKDRSADLLLTHTFKPNILGRIAARRAGIPIVAVSRGWTWENLKVRAYEAADRVNLRFVDRVVAVSAGQWERVRMAGVPSTRLSVIRNAARLNAFAEPDPEYRSKLRGLFPDDMPLSQVVLAAGRLSPEKGFGVLLEAIPAILKSHPSTGFVLFGEGAERAALEGRLAELGLRDRVQMPGFTAELDKYLPWADAVVLPSFTEGLPNVALEASAAGVPIVATAVGGTPEVVAHGETGLLVPSGQPMALADGLNGLLGSPELRQRMGAAGRRRMREQFTFEAQAKRYGELFEKLVSGRSRRAR